MRIGRKAILGAAIALLGVSQSGADIYNDAINDLNDGTVGNDMTGFPHLDIASVEINNNASDITFIINLNSDPIATDWGKYMIGIDSVAGGDTAGNGWSRPISMSSGLDYWIGSWVDFGGGAETYSWDGATWNLDHATYSPPSDIDVPGLSVSSVTLTTSLASLGLTPGDSFVFDVFSSGGGGGDSAIDALSVSTPSVTDWPGPFDSTSALTYTVIPEPATIGLISIFGVGLIAVRRRFKI